MFTYNNTRPNSSAKASAPAVTLNEDQQAAADAFFQFLFSREKEFIIKGPGGVGKTHLMGYMIHQVIPMYEAQCELMGIKAEFDEVLMTATTNKAAEALAQSTGKPMSTIHSFLRLKPRNNYQTGETKLTRNKDWAVHSRKIVFIDECSMIDSQLYYELHAALDDSCRIIYVGDQCQLPPVLERTSPIYKQKISSAELTENVRASDQPALLSLLEQLRETTRTLEFKPIQLVPGVIDHMNDDEIQQEIAQRFTQQNQDDRILCYTNNRVRDFNDYIRRLRQLPDRLTTGELLVNNNTYVHKNFTLPVEAEVKIVGALDHTFPMTLEDDSQIECYAVDIQLRSGVVHKDIVIPVDPDHLVQLTKYYARKKMWSTHFELKEGFPDLRQRDAGTVYKAQGSTYDTVIIDLGDISTSNNPRQVAHMLYVAFSRPKTRAILFGNLAQKYGSLVG